MAVPDLVSPGRYRHFKGGEYIVVGVARDSETKAEMVVYHPSGNPADLWVRSVQMWNEMVERDGVRRQRFERLESNDG
jgi:hypothetical protein